MGKSEGIQKSPGKNGPLPEPGTGRKGLKGRLNTPEDQFPFPVPSAEPSPFRFGQSQGIIDLFHLCVSPLEPPPKSVP